MATDETPQVEGHSHTLSGHSPLGGLPAHHADGIHCPAAHGDSDTGDHHDIDARSRAEFHFHPNVHVHSASYANCNTCPTGIADRDGHHDTLSDRDTDAGSFVHSYAHATAH